MPDVKTVTVAQMREADKRCIEHVGIPGVVLMHNAGAAVFQQVNGSPVGVVCGKGNNGGDGFVVARLALLAQLAPQVVLVGRRDEVGGDAGVFMRAYENLGGRIREAPEPLEAAAAVTGLRDCPVLVDALLGTGTRGELRGSVRSAIEAWPPCFTVSVDVPSGMDADTGIPCGACVRSDVTVTFAFAKSGLVLDVARPYVGKLIVADIGIPECCADDSAWESVWARLARHRRHDGSPRKR